MDIFEEIRALTEKYPDRRGALLPALYIAQEDAGWLSQEALERVSSALNLPQATVKGVATFYSMYKHRPMGRHLIQLCTNVACMIMGAESLVDFLKGKYGLEPGGTTGDGRFSLVIMECIGACDRAPAMLVDTDFHSDLTEGNIVEILEEYE
ncbi:NADH-quinone oxidoreductase subunit E [bacterium BMS3Bbin07]|nr:NADH-quinone oxidoreductase subunit E [bacterium BMS3Bbin07]HDH01818.1 NADH-quinone oxidoreductase subunit NuoE [Nitrospirota bacterium]